jgi:hypothetical protein
VRQTKSRLWTAAFSILILPGVGCSRGDPEVPNVCGVTSQQAAEKTLSDAGFNVAWEDTSNGVSGPCPQMVMDLGSVIWTRSPRSRTSGSRHSPDVGSAIDRAMTTVIPT